ncbi:MAG TPA: ATP-binding cassette domain-containing protein [Candidatus Cloacimonadota bacterium]|nr:ATP-binding cassette domain-containing protein [Candidatus Cloacimonadota bacterium]HPS37904.1 ATP-binding cassette domain-containing protein [Candidatus Cloacimonadota bacterium]
MKDEAVISTTDLVAKYGEQTILEGVSVDFLHNKVNVVLGGSGCGKTTLMRNILRLEQPFSGSVRFWGEEVTDMDEKEFNRILKRVGVLFQNGALMNSISVFENISIPLEQHTRVAPALIERIVRTKLSLVGLDHAIHLLPSELSGGMKKRAALARAIVLDPDLLICDEPSAGLDPETSAHLDELILDLKHKLNMTMIIVTHELASIHRIADRLIFLDSGKLLFQGTLAEAKSSNIEQIDRFFSVGKF